MDMVYRDIERSTGLLDVYFDKQSQLDILSCLIEGGNLAPEQVEDLKEVLELIAEDVYFTRCWTLQESSSSALGIELLQ